MSGTLTFLFHEAYPPEVLDRRMNEFPYLPSADGPFGPVIFSALPERRPATPLTGRTHSHRIVAIGLPDYNV